MKTTELVFLRVYNVSNKLVSHSLLTVEDIQPLFFGMYPFNGFPSHGNIFLANICIVLMPRAFLPNLTQTFYEQEGSSPTCSGLQNKKPRLKLSVVVELYHKLIENYS